jgi:integrase
MAISDTTIRNLKATGKKQKLSDGGGLQFWLLPGGTKTWRYAYRFGGSQKDVVLGQYPAVGLAEARRRRDDAKKLLGQGIDPAQQKKLDKLTKNLSDASTFEAIAAELLAKKEREGIAPTTLKRLGYQLRYVLPALGKRPIAAITAPEVLAALKKIEAKGTFETATRTKELCGAVFRYAMATGRASTDPTVALKGALTTHKVKHRAAILKADAFGELLRAIDGFEGQPTTKAALQLLTLVFTRPGELRNACWSEFDLDAAVWTVPAGRMKMRVEHHVPLPRQAIEILQWLKQVTGKGRLLFPGNRSVERPISDNTLNAALRRLGYDKDTMSGHGFRSSASTMLNESGRFSPDAIERALSHQDRDEIRRAYNRGAYWQERVAMAQWWADRVDEMRCGGSRSTPSNDDSE